MGHAISSCTATSWAPADAGAAGWDASGTAYQAQWDYSLAGKIDSLTQSVAGLASAVTGYEYSTSHPAAATSTTTGSVTDAFSYDTAGRMVSRTVDDVTTNLSWDVTSSLVESGKPGVVGGVSTGQGGHTVYAYDVSGQRVLQARVPDASHTGSATGYVGLGEITDTDTTTPAVASSLQASRYYSFGGATVAVRTSAGLSLMLGDEQDSVSVTMPLSVDTATGVVSPATLADALAATRTAYTPYGVLRGDDNLAVDRGWLGQTEDRIEGTGPSSTGTGLTYLNARYYDPVLSRFLSPDPLMNPGDPKTLDPYRYADNNPVVFTDASGLSPCSGLSAGNEAKCMGAYNKGTGYKAPSKPFTAKFAGDFVKGVWKTLATDAVGMLSPVMVFNSTKLAVTNPKGFFGQYGQAWNTATDVAKANWAGAGSALSVLKGDKSWGDHVHDLTYSSMYAHIGESWDAKDADAVSSTWAHTVEIASIASGIKGGIKTLAADGGLTALERGAAKVPEGWGPGIPNKKDVGTRWFDPDNQGNGIRIDAGNTSSSWPSQQVDHVVVRSGGSVLGPDGNPIAGPLKENPHAHVPLTDWLNWAEWNRP